MNICIVLTTRGNYAKFKKLLELLPDAQVIIGGELLLSDRTTTFEIVEQRIHRKVYFNLAGDTLITVGKSTGLAIGEFCNAFEEIKPDLVMLVGDRFETFAATTAAYMCGIKIAHLEGGEVSGSLDNHLRYAISEFSTYHFPCTDKSAQNLRDRGYENVWNVGCTSLDVLETVIPDDFDEFQKNHGSGAIIDTKKSYLLVIFHPDTSHYDNIQGEIDYLIDTVDSFGKQTIWINANMDAGSGIVGAALRQYRDSVKPDFIHFFKSLPIEHYGPLLANAKCIIGNSSSGIREGAFLGTPNINMGHRQENRELGENTKQYCTLLNARETQPDYLYGDGTASKQIVEILCTLE